jgi:hypothetical protein
MLASVMGTVVPNFRPFLKVSANKEIGRGQLDSVGRKSGHAPFRLLYDDSFGGRPHGAPCNEETLHASK